MEIHARRRFFSARLGDYSLQRFNSVLIVDSFCSTDEDPDL